MIGYSYNVGSTKSQQIEIDDRTRKSRERFYQSFFKAVSLSLVAYALYSFKTSAAYANSNIVETPADVAGVQPTSTPAPTTPNPVTHGKKGSYVGRAIAILKNGDFYIALACVLLYWNMGR